MLKLADALINVLPMAPNMQLKSLDWLKDVFLAECSAQHCQNVTSTSPESLTSNTCDTPQNAMVTPKTACPSSKSGKQSSPFNPGPDPRVEVSAPAPLPSASKKYEKPIAKCTHAQLCVPLLPPGTTAIPPSRVAEEPVAHQM